MVSSPTWLCAQIGAREHYAVPRALMQAGRLKGLFTDFWAGTMVRSLARLTGSGKVRSLAARFHPELENAVVWNRNWRALGWEARLRSAQNGHQGTVAGGQYHGFVDVGSRFAVCLREALKRSDFLGPDSTLFAYDTGALEALEWAQAKNIRCILNQMDPNRVEQELVREEEKRWPGWAVNPMDIPEDYYQRREREWALADRVVVNSEFCKQALLKQGVAPEKLCVIPLCYERDESGRNSQAETRKSGQPLRMLFLGQVILRKGIQYLVQAARLLEKENVQFDIVGPIGISAEALASAPKNVSFHGRVLRDAAVRWYRQADVFVLPTLSDGFAITQLEAMAHGLPVIATLCCGAVVSDGVDGFLIPPCDANALVQRVQRYLSEPDLLPSQQAAALKKSTQFTLERLAGNLLSLEQTFYRCSPSDAGSPRFAASHV